MPSASGGLAKSGRRASSCRMVSALAWSGLSFSGLGRSDMGAGCLSRAHGAAEPSEREGGPASGERHACPPPRGPGPPRLRSIRPCRRLAAAPRRRVHHAGLHRLRRLGRARGLPRLSRHQAADLEFDDLFQRTLQALAGQSRLRAGRRGQTAWCIAATRASWTAWPDSWSRWRAIMPPAASRSTSPGTAPAARWRRWRRAACTRPASRCGRRVVFSAPRVGDRRFAASYPLPLLRIEHRHDLIPHLPLPPSLAEAARPWPDRSADRRTGLAVARRCAASALAGTEYVHAGQLLYDDGARPSTACRPGDYLRRFGPLLRQELAADLLGAAEPRTRQPIGRRSARVGRRRCRHG